jgi:hypothetical protein
VIIKYILLIGLAGVGFYAFRVTSSSTHLAIRRLAGLLVLALGAVSVVFPNVTAWAASKVGVTRGADLVFYTLTVASLFVWSSVYARLQHLEDKYGALVRHLAIMDARREVSVPAPDHSDSAPSSDTV